MQRVLGSVLVLAGLTGSAAARPGGDDMHELPAPMQLDRGDAPRGVTVYLNRDGGAITGGWDDSASNVSSVAWGMGVDVDVPAWRGSNKRWKSVVQCVRDRFADFQVDVVTERPSRGDYVMIMVGGEPSMLRYPDSVGGVAPYDGGVQRSAIGFVFADSLGYDKESTCASILHETGHALGLDHEYLCEDPMSYLWGCGEKTWQDADAACGEDEERECGDGAETQNSYRTLAANVGLRDAPAQEEPEPVVDAGPTIAIDPTDDEITGNGWIEIDVRVAAASDVAEVELAWASEEKQWLFACSSIDEDMPARCRYDGEVAHFWLYVGTGLRAMAARVTDGAGNQAVTDARVLLLSPD
jgi:hypothetical protein